MTRKDECNRNIRDLGVLPEEAFEKYVNEKLERVSNHPTRSSCIDTYYPSPVQLVKKLHAVNEGLKKFAHVNKKAFEQYTSFTKQRDTLLERREELDKSAESIEDLVQVLDQRKDEAIERTFKQVAKNFEEVFEKLVPAGRGRLIIQRRIDQVSSHYLVKCQMADHARRMRRSTMRQKIRSKARWTIIPGSLSR